MSYLLDTDTCSAHLRRRGSVPSRFFQHLGHLHVSVITVGELMTWALRSNSSPKRMQGVQDMLDDVAVLEISDEIANEFGRLRAGLLDVGRPTPEMDLWIAATATYHRLTVVTHNSADFEHVPGIRLDDWIAKK